MWNIFFSHHISNLEKYFLIFKKYFPILKNIFTNKNFAISNFDAYFYQIYIL